jgi:hypothetical protein
MVPGGQLITDQQDPDPQHCAKQTQIAASNVYGTIFFVYPLYKDEQYKLVFKPEHETHKKSRACISLQ